MALFKHTRNGAEDYCASSPSQMTTPCSGEGRPDINQAGFFSNEPVLNDPMDWTPGFITNIEGNRFGMRDMKKNECRYKFFIPAKLFDPEANYESAKQNVYQVIFGKQVTKRQNVKAASLDDDSIPESFKKWASLKNSRVSAPAPTMSAPASSEAPTRIQVGPGDFLEIHQEVYGAHDPEGAWVNGYIAGFTPDGVIVQTVTKGKSTFPFVISAKKKRLSDWKQYIVCAKKGGCPHPFEESKSEFRKQPGKAGLERALAPGDTLLLSNYKDLSDFSIATFIEARGDTFKARDNSGMEMKTKYAVPMDVFEHVGKNIEEAKKFILKVEDGEISAVNFRGR